MYSLIRSALALGLFINSSLSYSAEPTPGFHNESEAGVVVTSGNSKTQTYNVKELATYGWMKNLLKLNGKFLKAASSGVETARYWTLGLRYEREISERFGAFLGQNVESDPYSGYLQRYNTDIGGKYSIFKEDAFQWFTEAGYRYTVENRVSGQVKNSFLRLYTEAKRDWTKTFSSTLWIEYLPNLTVTFDYQLNSELSLAAAISEIFAIKTGYLVRYRNTLIPPAAQKTDTQFTTALVAKF